MSFRVLRFQFQSPSRGGHLRGSRYAIDKATGKISFSPLHEGDTSVAMSKSAGGEIPNWFQSPSRGGHLRGLTERAAPLVGSNVSVPFTRGTPPWRRPWRCKWRWPISFSPLHEGDTSVAGRNAVPIDCIRGFQSPSRGGHLRGITAFLWSRMCTEVSVPFTRGTPPWLGRKGGLTGGKIRFSPLHEGDTSVAAAHQRRRHGDLGFSPLHEGDTSVAGNGKSGVRRLCSFSPLHEGDTSVACAPVHGCIVDLKFQSPSRGGHLRG